MQRLVTISLLALPLAAASCTGKERKQDGDTKAKVAKAEPQKAETKAPPAKAPPTAEPQKRSNNFKKGKPARPGLTAEELKEYAKVQGDPLGGEFTLEQALAGDETLADASKGKLKATFETTMGSFECTLFEDKTPLTVANFVGLARGVRPFYDKKEDKWVKRPFFEGIKFHRVIPNFMVQTGDPTGSGTGGPGYYIVDEIDKSLKHNKAGIMSMANRGPNTGSSQFFITVRATPHLDNKHPVFGQCQPKVAVEISKVKTDARWDRPIEDVVIKKVTIARK